MFTYKHFLHCCFIISGGQSTTQVLTSQNPVSAGGSAAPSITLTRTTSGSDSSSVTPTPTSTTSSRAQGSRGSLGCLISWFFTMLFKVHVELSSPTIFTTLMSSMYTLFLQCPHLSQSEYLDSTIFKVKALTTQETSVVTYPSSYVYTDWVSLTFWSKTLLKWMAMSLVGLVLSWKWYWKLSQVGLHSPPKSSSLHGKMTAYFLGFRPGMTSV